MKINPKLFAVFTTIILAVFGALLGMGLGFFLYARLVPSWTSHEIRPLSGAKDILQVDIQSTRDDPTQDILYVAAEDGRIFSNTLFQASWQPVAAAPQPEDQSTSCTSGRRDGPPVKSGIVSSAGFRFERPLSTILRCYVLLDDGRLQVWTHSTDLFRLLVMVTMGGATGLVAGAMINAFAWREKKRLLN